MTTIDWRFARVDIASVRSCIERFAMVVVTSDIERGEM